ncbi:hypothetical protein AALP_AA8G187800 [Arabis alpina]|uniref:Uncharacterized protein n=1 Tax=Arabis alpina TaxID=50452 RepID=A0A087G7Y0_ARAAL|nr:hypothetical protein AALP_AA8G187800 [Arabis alpina]
MVFVGVPWLFWFLAYVYSCVLKPCTVSVSKSVANFDPEKGEETKKIPEIATPTPASSDHTARNSPSSREGEKHVQFGNVVVLGDQEEEGKEENEGSSNNLIQNLMRMEDEEKDGRSNSRSSDDDDDDESSFGEECDRTPLRLSVANN